MKQSLRLGRVAGIPVGAHWSTLLIVLLIGGVLASTVLPQAIPGQPPGRYWVVAAFTAILFLASLLGHELAHALVARRRGVPVTSITLWLLGGVTEFAGESRTPRDEFRIAVAGPLVSLILGAVFFLAATLLAGPALVVAAVRWLALMNGVLAVFNMLPGAPLDGGRVLHAVLWRRTGDRARADRAASRSGQGLGMALIAVGAAQLVLAAWTGGLWMMLIGWFLVSAARGEGMIRAAQEGLKGWRVRDVMTPSPDVAPAWQDVDDFITTTALRSRQSVFPVVDFAGGSAGVLTLQALTAVAPERRHDLRIAALARPLTPEHLMSPDDDASRILERSASSGELMAVVTEAGHVVGMVTKADFTRALQQAVLRTMTEPEHAPDARPGQPGEPLRDGPGG
ncbi:site-2 protease family protein [Sphaerisporangium album]|uniref:Zinc metalloprotease n=1 Tax=Sphaerisporangium album TaxID=509200 RepID=A0A367FJH5_9ACTN|nr:site-2 protease family protein [Sphaerisporangium album]RCG29982.1 site-2 protease family protein [Sphaerisporangium album]